MKGARSRVQLVDRVVSMVHERTSLLSKLLMDTDGETSSLDNFSSDPEFAQFLDSIESVENSAKAMTRLLAGVEESAPDTVALFEYKVTDSDGVFLQIDRLSQAVGELEYEIAKDVLDYIQLASLLEAIRDETSNTEAFHEVDPLGSILRRHHSAKSKLKKILFSRYRNVDIFPDAKTSATSAAEFSSVNLLKGANNVIDAMGKDVSAELVEALIDVQMIPYHTRGRFLEGDLYSLHREALDVRWDELFRMLTACSAVNNRSMISVEWNLPFSCYVAFCTRTTEHLRVLLNTEVENLRLLGGGEGCQRRDHVTMLVQVLESVLNIENEVHIMFDKGVYTLAPTEVVTGGGTPSMGRRFSMSSRNAIMPSLKRPGEVAKEVHRCTMMSTMIAEEFMDPYVQCERRNAEDALTGLVDVDVKKSTSEEIVSEPVDKSKNKNAPKPSSRQLVVLSDKELVVYTASCLAVYDSAVVLFQITRSSMLRCAALSNGKPLLSLLLEYKVMFQIYAEMLRNMLCPSLPSSASDIMSSTRKQRTPHPLLLSEEVMACRAIMTADHCVGLIPQLEAEMLYKMSDAYKEDVHMKFQCELFEDVISYAIDILVSHLLSKVDDAAMVHMANTNWSKFDIVGDVSPYVFFMSRTLSELIPRLRKVLPEDYFDTLCLRFSGDFLDRFLALMMGLKGLGVAGAQQMLLDVNEMKPILISLHSIESKSGTGASTTSQKAAPAPIKSAEYDEVVNRKCGLLATVLKLVQSDDKLIDETFNVLWPEGTAGDLRAIKKLKSKENNLSSRKDSDLNQYLDRRSFKMDESAYSTASKGMIGSLSSALGSMKRNISSNKKPPT